MTELDSKFACKNVQPEDISKATCAVVVKELSILHDR